MAMLSQLQVVLRLAYGAPVGCLALAADYEYMY